MTTFRRAVLIPLAVGGLLLAACGADTEASDGTPLATTVTTAAPPSTTPPSTTPPATNPPATDPPTPTTLEAGPRQVDVLIGTDDSPTRIETVPLGSPVTINITNPSAADEFHLHGYDLEQSVPAGVMAVFNFDAITTGQFEVESHETHGVLVVIDVIP